MKFLSYSVMIYMLLALIWWSVLLNRTNEQLFNKNVELLEIKKTASTSHREIYQSQYEETLKQYTTKKYMILGEGIVFGISLIIGIWFIQKAYLHELENSRRQKNFLLSVTHELKSPIASINLLIETLQKRNLPPPKVNEFHDNILGESKRLDSLISKLLLATRLDNVYKYNFENNNIVSIIHSVLTSIRVQFPNANIKFDEYLTNIEVECDKEAIVSVVNNLVENGIKYAPQDSYIEINLTQTEKFVQISVKDNGHGIPEHEKEKVFHQFYRIGNEETRISKGTGLGLFIVKKIVESHLGTIQIEDNKPTGTIFTISLPLKQHAV